MAGRFPQDGFCGKFFFPSTRLNVSNIATTNAAAAANTIGIFSWFFSMFLRPARTHWP